MKKLFILSPMKACCNAMLALLGLTGCEKSNHHRGPLTIYQTIANDQQLEFLTVAINKAGLKETLNGDDKTQFTVFAPTNEAFQAAGFKTVQDVANAPAATLKSILLYHVLSGKVEAGDIPLASNTPVTTIAGTPIYVTRTNAGGVFINGVSVIQANIECTNGVIHKINRVLIPAVGNIVQTAQGNANLSLLVAAVLRASQGSTNVAAVLSGAGPFTVFAPTNQAFINAGFADANAINAADPNVLTSILTYHVIAGRIFSSDLADGIMPATVNGETVTITLGSGPQVKGKGNTTASNIIATDIVTTNGVVHVIDQVLLP